MQHTTADSYCRVGEEVRVKERKNESEWDGGKEGQRAVVKVRGE